MNDIIAPPKEPWRRPMVKRESKKWADMSALERLAIVAIMTVVGLVAGVVLWIFLGVLVTLGQFVWKGIL